jgi:ethanolamine utilization protein EutN
MILGRVIGKVVATQKDQKLEGAIFRLVQLITHHGKKEGSPVVAVDFVQCGDSDLVYLVKGREASFPWIPEEAPIDLAIVGIVDKMEKLSS